VFTHDINVTSGFKRKGEDPSVNFRMLQFHKGKYL